MADVFLSYKREDAVRVRKLVGALRSAGLDVWWDEDIPPSAPWEPTIERELADSEAVIVCWSPASVASENVRSEARVAREDGRLIQVFVKPCSPPLFFGERQGVDLSKWRGDAADPRIGAIVNAVRSVAAGERTEAGERPRSRRPDRRTRILTMAALGVLVLAAGSLVAWRSAIARSTPEVAVLPFEDLSPGHDKAYFAEGVSEEILSSLSTDKAIKVLGRTSAREIDRNADPKVLRDKLGITDLLEGSARTAGDALRVDVRLIDTKDGTAIWQDEYQGRLSDVFAMQDKVAAAVAHHLRGLLIQATAPAARPTTKVDVYQSYLAARSIMRKRTEPSLRQALRIASQVVATDPNYAPGQALYAELVYLLSNDPLAYGTIPLRTAGPIAERHARAAIQLAPGLADGYAALGLISSVDDQQAIAALRRAIALDPSRADVRLWLALRLTKLGRYDEVLQQARDAATIEPLWALPLEWLVEGLTMSGREAEARASVEQFRARTGNMAEYFRHLFLIDLRGNDLARAVAEGTKAHSLDSTLPDLRQNLMSLYYTLGLEERAPQDLPEPFIRLARPYYVGNSGLLQGQIRSSGAGVWDMPDGNIAFFFLAQSRDWTSLIRLYDLRPAGQQRLCFGESEAAMAITEALVPALRASGLERDAGTLTDCMRARLAIESRQKSRQPTALLGDYEFDQASLAAFEGDREGAIRWLRQAVDEGWLGRPYTPAIADRPQFDMLRSDRRMAALQARIDRTIAQQRAQILAGAH